MVRTLWNNRGVKDLQKIQHGLIPTFVPFFDFRIVEVTAVSAISIISFNLQLNQRKGLPRSHPALKGVIRQRRSETLELKERSEEVAYMWHFIKGLDILLDRDGVGKGFDSFFILMHRREETEWNLDRRPVFRVYHCRMSGRSSSERRVGAGC